MTRPCGVALGLSEAMRLRTTMQPRLSVAVLQCYHSVLPMVSKMGQLSNDLALASFAVT